MAPTTSVADTVTNVYTRSKMSRLKTNIVVDVALLLTTALLSLSGWVVKYALPSGRGRQMRVLESPHEFLCMDRHTWRDIHLWSGIALVALLVLHVAFHWGMIAAFFTKHIPHRLTRYLVYLTLLVLCAVAVGPWVYSLLG